MKLLAHRGNIFGPNRKQENEPDYVNGALLMGFDVEVDVWHTDGQFFLGHDAPQYPVSREFLENPNIWCHAKNIEAIIYMFIGGKIHCFWHQDDMMTITSKGYIWTCDVVCDSTISILMATQKRYQDSIRNAVEVHFAGICSDWVGEMK